LYREITNHTANRPGKSPAGISDSYSPSFTQNKLVTHRASNSDFTGAQVNVAELKHFYKQKQDVDAEKYLKEIIMEEAVREPHVVGYIIWKSLLQWDSFKSNSGTSKSILVVCSKAVETFVNSKTKQVDWLGTCITLLYLAEEEKWTLSSEESVMIQDFVSQLQSLTSLTFENATNVVKERLEVKTRLEEYLFSESKTDDTKFQSFWEQLTDTVTNIMAHSYFPGVKTQFLNRLLSYLVICVMDGLFKQVCSYSVGVQVKMLIDLIEKWTNDLMKKNGLDCPNIIEVELEPLRQASSILCLRQKTDLLKSDIRQALCSLLRPIQISQILDGYRTDNFDKVAVPQGLVEKIVQQDSTYTPLPNTFDLKLSPRPLQFNFQMDKLNFDRLEIPKVILDKPAFSFLKKRITSNDNLIVSPW